MTRFLLVSLLLVIALSIVRLTGEAGSSAPVGVATVRAVEPSPAGGGVASAPRIRSGSHRRCTAHNWRKTLRPAERFIDYRESRLSVRAVEPTTGALGLGQLKPQTYAALGLPVRLTACAEIRAQRAYKTERYGTWANAKAHEMAVGWW